jgi:hypothetical protein
MVTSWKATVRGATLGVAVLGLLAAGVARAETCPKRLSAAEQVVALNAIQNLVGRYSHLAELRGEATLAELFAMHTEGVSWRTPVGPVGIKGMQGRFSNPAEKLPGVVPGALHVHSMLTPVIEIAADGNTARGVWDSFGPNIANANEIGDWLWLKYGVDFVKEAGQWKIWHLQAYAIFSTPYDKSITQSARERAGANDRAGRPGPPDASWTGPKEMWVYDGKTAPRGPKIPEPYCSFDPQDSYGNV